MKPDQLAHLRDAERGVLFEPIERGVLFEPIERGVLFEPIERGVLFEPIERMARVAALIEGAKTP